MLPVTRYSPESKMRHPVLLVKEMWHDLKSSKELAWRLTIRDISAQYRQTMLGYFWAIFPPVISGAVFLLLKSSSVFSVSGIDLPYPVYVLMGTFFFQLFVDALNSPLKIVTESKAVLTKINMPREALILSGIGQVLFSFAIKVVLLIILFIIYRIHISWSILLIPVPVLGLLFLGTMLGVFLIPAGLLYKDIQSALLLVTQVLIFITPVGFTPQAGGFLQKVVEYNPVTPLLMTARDLVSKGIPQDPIPFLLIFAATFVLLFISWVIYRLALPIIIERIGA